MYLAHTHAHIAESFNFGHKKQKCKVTLKWKTEMNYK